MEEYITCLSVELFPDELVKKSKTGRGAKTEQTSNRLEASLLHSLTMLLLPVGHLMLKCLTMLKQCFIHHDT